MTPDVIAAQAVIDDFVARGIFRAECPEVGPDGTALWRVRWFGGHVLAVRIDRQGVTVAPLLPPLSARSALYRDLRAWLLAQQSEALPAHRRLDPAVYRLNVNNSAGDIRLSLKADETPEVILRRTVQLIHAIYLDFLNGPGRLEWVTEAFGLDPDNPRLC